MKQKEIHNVDEEMIGFETLIFDYFLYASIKFDRNNKNNFDAYLPNGLENHFINGCYLEIKYSNNIFDLKNYAKNNSNINLIIISLSNVTIIEKDYIILGVEFIKKIIKKCPNLWWNFGAEVIDDNYLTINHQDDTISMAKLPLAGREVNLSVSLGLNSIDELSSNNASAFKKLKNKYNSTTIIIGNGVSIPFGSDSWDKLADSLFDYLTPFYVDNLENVKKCIGESNYFTSSISKETIKKADYQNALYNCIYKKYDNRMHTSSTLIRAISNIKKNNKVNLLTYNYDQFVEIDYELLTKQKLYSITSDAQDKKISGSKIYHLHGLIDYKNHNQKNVILTENEYFKAYTGNGFAVRKQLDSLNNDLCLFVGSSMSDLFQLSLISRARNKMLNNGKSWKCFALMPLINFSNKDKVAIYNFYIKKGIYLIFVDSFKELPEKLSKLF